jgi:hypothetical protein
LINNTRAAGIPAALRKMENTMYTQILNILRSSKGKIFTVEFVKKNGRLRRMNCRLGVTYCCNGKGLKYDPLARGLLPVYDMQAKGYRMVSLDTIKSIKLNGKEYIPL